MSRLNTVSSSIFAFALITQAVHAEALRPSAGRRLVANAAIVSNELRQVFDSDTSRAGEQLREIIDTSGEWRLYYRDRQLLIAIPVRRNLLGGEKAAGEGEAAESARAALQQKFGKMLDLDKADASGLDRTAVRVVFIEPDVGAPYVRGVSVGGWSQGGYGVPLPFAPAGAWTGWAAPAGGCGCH